MKKWKAILLLAGAVGGGVRADTGSPAAYNVVWDSPSRDARGSMPLGNGDIGLNAWVEPGGDLLFYISKTDAWGDNARLLKVGKVRVTCDPPLVRPGGTFRQELHLESGTLEITTSNTTDRVSHLSLWVDANHPVIQVTVDGDVERTVTASIEL